MMHDPQKSDSPIVAVKPPNNPGRTGAAAVEPRGGTKGITNENRTTRTPSRTRVLQGLERVRERAKAHRKERFTALLHHLDVDLLRGAYFWLKKTAAAGIDGITWEEYGKNLEDRLVDLHGRVHRGGSSSPKRMESSGRLASQRSRTKSSSAPWWKCSTQFMRWILRGSHTGSGPNAASIKRWMRWRLGLSVRQ